MLQNFNTSDNNFNNQTHRQNSNKQTIKVFVFIGESTSGIVAHETSIDEKTKQKIYERYSWELFQKCMKDLVMDKYNFEIIYSKPDWTNYSQTIKDIHSGKYDIAIAGFLSTYEREKLVNFSTPVKIDANAIYHLKTESDVVSELFFALYSISGYIVISIVIGILIGVVLYYGNPKRMKFIGSLTKKSFFIRSIITGIAAMFGEMGFLSENASRTYRGAIIVIITMLVAYISLIIIQAQVTSILVENRINKSIDPRILESGVILGHEGYAVAKKIKEDGAKMKFVKDLSNEELLMFYLKNTDKYKGVALSYCDAYPCLTKHPELQATLGFGNEPSSWPVNNDKQDFLEKLNRSLLSLRKSREMQLLCTKYFGNITGVPTCSLR